MDFEKYCNEFGNSLYSASDWKNNFGAAYSTRVIESIKHAENAIKTMKQVLQADGVDLKRVGLE